jgi:hypothetical protein
MDGWKEQTNAHPLVRSFQFFSLQYSRTGDGNPQLIGEKMVDVRAVCSEEMVSQKDSVLGKETWLAGMMESV